MENALLNLIEGQFGVFERISLTNTDDPTMRPGIAASALISATDTATSPTYISQLTVSAQLGLSSWKLRQSVLVECLGACSHDAADMTVPQAPQRFDVTAHPIGSHARIAGTDQLENSLPFPVRRPSIACVRLAFSEYAASPDGDNPFSGASLF